MLPKSCLLVLVLLAPSQVIGSHGFLTFRSDKSPAELVGCIQNSTLISRRLEIKIHDGVYRISNDSDFLVEIGKSISTGKTLLRLRPHATSGRDDLYSNLINRCL